MMMVVMMVMMMVMMMMMMVRRTWKESGTTSYETINLQSPSPALHDLPSPDLTSANPVVKRQPQQKFFPAQAKR